MRSGYPPLSTSRAEARESSAFSVIPTGAGGFLIHSRPRECVCRAETVRSIACVFTCDETLAYTAAHLSSTELNLDCSRPFQRAVIRPQSLFASRARSICLFCHSDRSRRFFSSTRVRTSAACRAEEPWRTPPRTLAQLNPPTLLAPITPRPVSAAQKRRTTGFPAGIPLVPSQSHTGCRSFRQRQRQISYPRSRHMINS